MATGLCAIAGPLSESSRDSDSSRWTIFAAWRIAPFTRYRYTFTRGCSSDRRTGGAGRKPRRRRASNVDRQSRRSRWTTQQ
jgi:hypothetical protein